MVADANRVFRVSYCELALARIRELVSGLVKDGVPPEIVIQIVRDACAQGREDRSRSGEGA